MKSKSVETSTTEPRRSSRIRENVIVVKRKIEEDPIKEVKKRPRREKIDSISSASYFSIFGKKQSSKYNPKGTVKFPSILSISTTVPKKKGRPTSSRSGVLKCKDEDDVVIIDMVDLEPHDYNAVSQEKHVVPFNFVSAFMEPGLPVSHLCNHVQQLDSNFHISDIIFNLTILSDSTNIPVVSTLSAITLRNINCHFDPSFQERNDFNNKPRETNNDHSLWVDKYNPKDIADVLGHSAGIELLASWLNEWKQKLKRPNVRSHGEMSTSNSSFAFSEEEDDLLKCVLLSGSSGRGKTSVVYAIAHELGFKVFEVNPSSSRIGRLVLSQLQEASLSHHVEGTPKMLSFFGQIMKSTKPEEIPKSKVAENGNDSSKLGTLTKIKPRPGQITNFFQTTSVVDKCLPSPEQKMESKKKGNQNLLSFFKPQAKIFPTAIALSVSSSLGNKPMTKSQVDDNVVFQTNASLNNHPVLITSVSSKPEEQLCKESSMVNSVFGPSGSETVSKGGNPYSNSIESEIIISQDSLESSRSCEYQNSGKSSKVCDIIQCRNKLSRKRREHKTPAIQMSNSSTIISLIHDLFADNATNGEQCNEPDTSKHLDKLKECNVNDEANIVQVVPEVEGLKFSSLSIILFDDADINLMEDEGFWPSIKTFLKITRKPVILTASGDIEELLDNISSDVKVLDFGTIDSAYIIKHLKHICKLEKLVYKKSDLKLLFQHCQSDLRCTITQLQFWNDPKETYTGLWKISPSLPASLLCLSSNCRRSLFEWVFKTNFSQVAELIFQFNIVGYDLLHNNMHLWLPFPIEVRKQDSEIVKPVREYKRIDISWLTDDESDDGSVPLTAPKNKKCDTPFVCETLECLADLYQSFSSADIMENCEVAVSNSLWFENRTSHLKDFCASSATEVASWTRLYASRLTSRVLKKYPTDCMPIYGDEQADIILHRPIDEKLIQARQSITNSTLCMQRLNHAARCLDYFSMLRTASKCEESRKLNNPKRSRRFLHYFDSTGFTVDAGHLACLAKAFKE